MQFNYNCNVHKKIEVEVINSSYGEVEVGVGVEAVLLLFVVWDFTTSTTT